MANLEKAGKTLRLPDEWKTNEAGLNAIKATSASIAASGKHGVVSSIPIICRGDKCPYYETCTMPALGIDIETIVGQRCPIEITKIMNKFNAYVEDFDISLEDADLVTIGLIKELIDYEIQIDRADSVMARQGDFLEEVVVGVDANGRPIKNKEIAKLIDYKERATKKRHDILQLLNSTPKDKAGQKINVTMDPSTYAATLMARAKELREGGFLDAEVVELDE